MNNPLGNEEDKGCLVDAALSTIPLRWGSTHGRVEGITGCNAYGERPYSRCLIGADPHLRCKTLEWL
jgi:hypothetical protein